MSFIIREIIATILAAEYSYLTQLHCRLEQFASLAHLTLDASLLSYERYTQQAHKLWRELNQFALTPAPNCSRPHHGMRTPVKTTRDSHSEQCVSRKKTSAREARGGLAGVLHALLIRQYEPDLVVLKLRMPGLSGIEIAKEFASHWQTPTVVICLVGTDQEVLEAKLQAGAIADVFKTRIQKEFDLAGRSALRRNVLCHRLSNERKSRS